MKNPKLVRIYGAKALKDVSGSHAKASEIKQEYGPGLAGRQLVVRTFHEGAARASAAARRLLLGRGDHGGVPRSEPLTLAGRGRAPRCHRPENQRPWEVFVGRAPVALFLRRPAPGPARGQPRPLYAAHDAVRGADGSLALLSVPRAGGGRRGCRGEQQQQRAKHSDLDLDLH